MIGSCLGDGKSRPIDPRVKITVLFVWTIAVFRIDSFWVLLCILLLSVCLYFVLGCNREHLFKAYVAFSILAVVLLVSGAIRLSDEADCLLLEGLGFSVSGFFSAVKSVGKFAILIVMSMLVTETTDASRLTNALRQMLSPLRKMRVPVDEIATMLVVALRFIPLCSEKMDELKRAQRGRGIRVGEGNPFHRVLSYVPLMAPMVVSLFRVSENLADAMVARCYRGIGRTQLHESRLTLYDLFVGLTSTAVAVSLAIFA